MQNLKYVDGFVESIDGTEQYHDASVGTDPFTAILPYYNSDTGSYTLLAVSGDTIYKKIESQNKLSALKQGLQPNTIFGNGQMRLNVLYIPTQKDGLLKYLGGNQIETVGGGATQPGSFRVLVFMKEVDRFFGLGYDTIKGQITWSDFQKPEQWDGANVDNMKLSDGEIVETADTLYGKLIILNTYSIWTYFVGGNEENWRLEQAPTTVGCRAPETKRKVGNEIWFLGESPRSGIGVYAFNGTTARLLTDDVTPLLDRINPNRIRECAAEYHDDIYTLSFPLDAALENDHSIDLDTLNLKDDGTPAIYGPHTFGFRSSAVLNTTMKSGEWIIGDANDGYLYRARGNSFKAQPGQNGNLIQHRFLSAIHNEGNWNTEKRFSDLSIFTRPTGYSTVRVKTYFSYSPYGSETNFFPQAHNTYGGAGGFVNVFDRTLYGTPSVYEHRLPLGLDAMGTSFQLELINDSINRRIAFQGYQFNAKELHTTKRLQTYAQ